MPTATPAHFDVDVTFFGPTFARSVKPLHFGVNVGFNAPAVYVNNPLHPWVFLLGGVDRTTAVLVAESPVTLQFQLGAIPSASFTAVSESATYRPTRGEEFVLIESATGERMFGGFIQSIEETSPPGTSCIKVKCSCVGYAAKLEERRVGAFFQAGAILYTPVSMMRDVLREYIPDVGITMSPLGSDGAVITTDVLFQWVTGLQAAKQLADPNGLEVYVDEYGRLAFVDATSGVGVAPFDIADNDGNVDAEGGGPRVRREAARYANRVLVRPDLREPGMWTDTWAGDEGPGASVGFYLTKYRLDNKPIVLLNGVQQTVGEYALSGSSNDFTYVPDGYGVVYVAGGLSSSDTVEIKYPIPLQPVYSAQDDAAIASFGRVVEILYDVRDVYEADRLQEIADGLLARHLRQPYAIEYQTMRSGLKPGQIQNINLTLPQVPNLDLLIDSVGATFQPTIAGGFFRWRITATNGAPQGEKDIVRLMQRIKAGLVQPQDRIREVIVFEIAMDDEPGATDNPGFTATGQLPGAREISRPGYIREVRVRFDRDGVQTATAQIDVRINGTSVFANSTYLEYSPDVTAGETARKFDFSSLPFAVVPGDIVTVWAVTGDAALKNGHGEIEIQG